MYRQVVEQQKTCSLCWRTATRRGTFRVAGLDLCEECFGGRSIDALRSQRGFVIAEQTWEQGAHSTRWTEVSGEIPGRVGVSASFKVEGCFEKIGKLGARELQTGDSEFDDRVLITTADRERLAVLLRHDGLRMAILDLLYGDLSVEIDEQVVRVAYCHNWQDPPSRSEVVRGVAVMLHYLHSLMVVSGKDGPFR